MTPRPPDVPGDGEQPSSGPGAPARGVPTAPDGDVPAEGDPAASGTGRAQRPQRKSVLLRLDPAVHDALARWAGDDLRSVNAQIEMLLRRALDDAGRLPRDVRPPRRPGRHPASDPPPPPAEHDMKDVKGWKATSMSCSTAPQVVLGGQRASGSRRGCSPRPVL
ncbi:hypothetical protein [Cellulosimicrobium cellulans]|uniref:hypothetical protein n=1 Tax=Cellulosimicrobium cellulans TaxID=1710 RepID=UPI001EDB5C78|nr:hypothetical protein [Cellulosimicrobium cellulans]